MDISFQIFIGFISPEVDEEEILDAIRKEIISESTITNLKLIGMERRMFTNYRILETNERILYQKLLNERIEIKGQEVECHTFRGEETYDYFVKKYKEQVVFLTGIPLTCDISFIKEKLNEFFELRDLFILKINKKVNKHFGFVTFTSAEDKKRALEMKKMKIDKFKITFKKFKEESLDKKLFKKKEDENEDLLITENPQSININAQETDHPSEQQMQDQEEEYSNDEIYGSEVESAEVSNIENPEDATKLLQFESQKIFSNHHRPGNISFNKPPRDTQLRNFPYEQLDYDNSTDPKDPNYFLLENNNRISQNKKNSSEFLFSLDPFISQKSSYDYVSGVIEDPEIDEEPKPQNPILQKEKGGKRVFNLFGNYEHFPVTKFQTSNNEGEKDKEGTSSEESK